MQYGCTAVRCFNHNTAHGKTIRHRMAAWQNSTLRHRAWVCVARISSTWIHPAIFTASFQYGGLGPPKGTKRSKSQSKTSAREPGEATAGSSPVAAPPRRSSSSGASQACRLISSPAERLKTHSAFLTISSNIPIRSVPAGFRIRGARQDTGACGVCSTYGVHEIAHNR